MDQILKIVMMNVAASAALYFGFAGIEKYAIPQVFHTAFSSWSAPASWSTWTPSVVIPAAYTAWKISPKLSGLAVLGIVGMWGGFMITDFQQPPFANMLYSALHIAGH